MLLRAETLVAIVDAKAIRRGLELLAKQEREGLLTPDQAGAIRAEYERALELLASSDSPPPDSP